MRQSLRVIGVAAGCLLVVAACGSSGNHSAVSTGSGGANGAGTSGEASKPATQILADAATALRTARGYVLQGTLTEAGQSARLRLVASAGSLDLLTSGSGGTAEVIVRPTGSYIRGDQTYWSAHAPTHAGLLANRWIEIPAANAQTLASQLGQFAPSTAAHCLTEGHGSLSVAGRTTVDGRPAVVIKDAGNVPGDGPGTLAVAATGMPYPLRITDTGPKRPGGHVDVCNDGKGDNRRGTLTFSQFGNPPAIKPPNHPVQIGQQGGAI